MKLPGRSPWLILAAMSLLAAAAPAAVPTPEPEGETLLLWPGGTPGAQRVTVKQAFFERSPDGPLRDRYAEHVTRPALTWIPPKGAPNGVTLLIVPGGG